MPAPAEWDLTGKAALITSDRRGWTPFLAAALAEAGADVAVAGSSRSDISDALDAVSAQGRRALRLETDLTSAEQVNAAVQEAVSEFGGVDILVNNARVEFGKPFVDVTAMEWSAVMDFNVSSMFLCCQAAGRHMLEQGGGRIVNIGSGLAERGLVNSAVASAAWPVSPLRPRASASWRQAVALVRSSDSAAVRLRIASGSNAWSSAATRAVASPTRNCGSPGSKSTASRYEGIDSPTRP